MITDEQAIDLGRLAAIVRSKPAIANRYDDAASKLAREVLAILASRSCEQVQPITAEWCRENGAKVHKHAFTRDGKRYWGACWIVANVVIVVYGGEYVHINGCEVARKLSRPELLAIVTALKGGAT